MRRYLAVAVVLALLCSVYTIPAGKPIDDLDEDVLADQEDEEMQGDTDNNYYDDSDDPANKENSDKSTDKPEEPPAQILTPETVFDRNIGEDVTFPCQTAPGDDGVILWYKDGAILYQGTVPMGAKSNNKLVNNSLEINNILPDDAGQYKCVSLVSTNNEAFITHTLKVRTPPVITALVAKNNRTLLTVGEELVLTCHAKGYPEPVISWHREIMRDGATENRRLDLTGSKLTIPNITRKDEGRYSCSADNKVGYPALSYINIELNHQPIVSIEKFIVNSDKNMDTELKCTVKAKPMAHVVWLRNGISLTNSEHIYLRNEDNDHILVLNGLEESDFGKYVCLAKNHLGTVEKSISLVKTPAILEFIKPEKPTRDLVLTWRVESKSPVIEHELQYRRKGDVEWQTIKPTVHDGDDGIYVMKYTLKNLGEGTYETRCRSQNQHGWSEYSDITLVEGEKSTTPHPDVALAQESGVGESVTTGAAVETSGSLLLSSIALLCIYLNRL